MLCNKGIRDHGALGLFCYIWKEHNSKIFREEEHFDQLLKDFFLKTFLERAKTLGKANLSLMDFIEGLDNV